MGVLQRIVASKQFWGDLPTYCQRCGKKQTMKFFKGDGSYTKMCACGCDIYTCHDPDANNITAYFTKVFVPAKKYRRDWKNKDDAEKLGFKCEVKGDKIIYSK